MKTNRIEVSNCKGTPFEGTHCEWRYEPQADDDEDRADEYYEACLAANKKIRKLFKLANDHYLEVDQLVDIYGWRVVDLTK